MPLGMARHWRRSRHSGPPSSKAPSRPAFELVPCRNANEGRPRTSQGSASAGGAASQARIGGRPAPGAAATKGEPPTRMQVDVHFRRLRTRSMFPAVASLPGVFYGGSAPQQLTARRRVEAVLRGGGRRRAFASRLLSGSRRSARPRHVAGRLGRVGPGRHETSWRFGVARTGPGWQRPFADGLPGVPIDRRLRHGPARAPQRRHGLRAGTAERRSRRRPQAPVLVHRHPCRRTDLDRARRRRTRSGLGGRRGAGVHVGALRGA